MIKSEGMLSQARLAAFSGIGRMQRSNILKILEEKNLITRARSLNDERGKALALTPRGIDKLAQVTPALPQLLMLYWGSTDALAWPGRSE